MDTERTAWGGSRRCRMVGVATAPSSFHHQEPAQRGQEQAERREPGPFGFVRTREDHCENG